MFSHNSGNIQNAVHDITLCVGLISIYFHIKQVNMENSIQMLPFKSLISHLLPETGIFSMYHLVKGVKEENYILSPAYFLQIQFLG